MKFVAILSLLCTVCACSSAPTASQKAKCGEIAHQKTTDKIYTDARTFDSCKTSYQVKNHDESVEKGTIFFLDFLLTVFTGEDFSEN